MLSRLRLRVFAAVAAAGLVSAGAYPVSSVGAQWLLIWSLVIAGPLLLAISAEADEMASPLDPRNVPHGLLAPFVPGNGRGVVFATLALLTVLGWYLGARIVFDRGQPVFGDDDPTQLAAICLFALSYCLAVAWMARFWPPGFTRTKGLVTIVGLTILALVSVGLVSPLIPKGAREVVLGLAFPPGFLDHVRQDGRWTWQGYPTYVALCWIVGALFALNLPRMVKGLSEVVRLRRQSRAAVV